MSRYSAGINLDAFAGMPFDDGLFPTLTGAMKELANAAHQQWQAYAQGAPLPNGLVINARSGTYHRSIQLEQITPFHYRVFSDLAYAEAIENGMPARDLKKILDSSLKVRRTKDGKRYLIIPFRWGTPGTSGFGKNVMPPAVHAFFQNKTPSRVISIGQRVSGTGAFDIKTRQPFLVPQRRYEWGARLTQQHLGAMGIGTQFNGKAYKTHPMAGMVNFRNPGGSGGSAHSSYLTFRVMSETSPGWKSPAIPGKFPAKTVAEKIKPLAERAIRKAVEMDIRAMFGE